MPGLTVRAHLFRRVSDWRCCPYLTPSVRSWIIKVSNSTSGSNGLADRFPEVWLVWTPGEDFPKMHKSREKAIEQAEASARLHLGATIGMFKLTSVGSIKYPDSPLITGEMNR